MHFQISYRTATMGMEISAFRDKGSTDNSLIFSLKSTLLYCFIAAVYKSSETITGVQIYTKETFTLMVANSLLHAPHFTALTFDEDEQIGTENVAMVKTVRQLKSMQAALVNKRSDEG